MKINQINYIENAKRTSTIKPVQNFTAITQKTNTIKSPVNPQYWQNVSFKALSLEETKRKNIKKKRKEISSRTTHVYKNEVFEAFIDKKTGEINPLAEKMYDIISAGKNSLIQQKKFNPMNKTINTVMDSSFLTDDEIIGFITSIKDNNGDFNKQNYKAMIDLIRFYKAEGHIGKEPEEFTWKLEAIKGKSGIATEEKVKKAKRYLHDLHDITGYNAISDVLKTIFQYPDAKVDEIYNYILNFGKDREDKQKLNIESFSALALCCFNKQGNINKKNIPTIEKLMNTGIKIPNKRIIEIAKDNPRHMEFLIKLSENTTNENILNETTYIYDNFKQKNGEVPNHVYEKAIEFATKIDDLLYFSQFYSACQNSDKTFDEKKFADLTKLIKANLNTEEKIKRTFWLDFIKEDFEADALSFNEKLIINNVLSNYLKIIPEEELTEDNLLYQKHKQIIDSINPTDELNFITIENKNNFIENVMKSDDSAPTIFEKTLADANSLLKTFNEGVPLRYSRKDFLQDLQNYCDKNNKNITKEAKKLNIDLVEKNGKIYGYNGFINTNNINQNDFELLNIANNFINNNEVITQNEELNKQLNYIIKAFPEFINIIGKKQHNTHKYTLDIHTLLNLSNCMKNPMYQKELTPTDKSFLKLAVIFHDITKKENEIDGKHPQESALFARNCSSKLLTNEEDKNRLYDIIKNHHWTKEYNTAIYKKEKASELAIRFRRPNDFEIAQIMAEADLKAVNENFWNTYKDCLKKENLEQIQKDINYIHSTGNTIFTSRITDKEKLKLHTREKDGKTYKVIDFRNIGRFDNLGQFGFEEGLKKDNAVFLAHAIWDRQIKTTLQTLKAISLSSTDGILSLSLITPEFNKLYSNRKYGVILSEPNINILMMSDDNLNSGIKKDLKKFLNEDFKSLARPLRNFYKNEFLNYLQIAPEKITEEEYAKFYKEHLANKKSLSEFNEEKTYQIGNFIRSNKEIIFALTKTQNDLINKNKIFHNEIVGITPTIEAVFAKETIFEHLPQELLNFAYENDYPIYLF